MYEETVSLRTRINCRQLQARQTCLAIPQGCSCCMKEPAFALRRESRANVEVSLDFATCTIVFRSEMEGWNT